MMSGIAERPFDRPHAAAAVDPFDGEFHAAMPPSRWWTKWEIARLGHRPNC
jgi:hypothetical protein